MMAREEKQTQQKAVRAAACRREEQGEATPSSSNSEARQWKGSQVRLGRKSATAFYVSTKSGSGYLDATEAPTFQLLCLKRICMSKYISKVSEHVKAN